jgi:hypothetical protein
MKGKHLGKSLFMDASTSTTLSDCASWIACQLTNGDDKVKKRELRFHLGDYGTACLAFLDRNWRFKDILTKGLEARSYYWRFSLLRTAHHGVV